MRKRRTLWLVLFIVLAGLMAAFTIFWNVSLKNQYETFSKLAVEVSAIIRQGDLKNNLQVSWITGTVLAYLAIAAGLFGMLVFFYRSEKESRYAQLQREFLARISHELKSPVASLELTSSMLKTDDTSREQRDRLWDIHTFELTRLKTEIELLVESSRWEAKGFSPQSQDLELESWLDSQMGVWQKILGVNGTIERSGDLLPLNIKCDPKLLELITNNFVDNARKFAKAGQAPHLEIHTQSVPKKKSGARNLVWSIAFRDQGMGFDPKKTRQLFRRFYRAKNRSLTAIPGTGLGLSLAKAASKALKIKIRAHSRGEGSGAEFKLQGEAP